MKPIFLEKNWLINGLLQEYLEETLLSWDFTEEHWQEPEFELVRALEQTPEFELVQGLVLVPGFEPAPDFEIEPAVGRASAPEPRVAAQPSGKCRAFAGPKAERPLRQSDS